VQSATTCAPGLASASVEPLLLPRLVDHAGLNADEFEGWMAGLSAWLPQRPYHAVDPEDEPGNVLP
jgi:hypothetical protein